MKNLFETDIPSLLIGKAVDGVNWNKIRTLRLFNFWILYPLGAMSSRDTNS